MPPGARSGMHSASQFLFVNQDAASVLGKANDRQVNQSKQSHVQRQHFLKKRQAQLETFHQGTFGSKKRHESAQNIFNGLNGEVLNENQPSDAQLLPFSSGQPRVTVEHQTSTALRDPLIVSATVKILPRAVTDNVDFSQQYLANNEVPRPRRGYALDPFSTTALELNPAAPSLIHYYTLVHKNRFESKLQIPGIKAGDEDRVSLYFKTQAMASVRRKLAEGDLDLGLFQVVYRLMATERCLENPEAAKTHFRALTAMVNALGGVRALDPYNRERIIHSDLFEAVQALRSPDLPLTWDPGNASAETIEKISPPEPLEVIGSGFFGIELSNVFHADMLDILSALTIVTHLTVYSWTSTADLTADDLSWQTLRRAAIEHRLLSFPSTHNDAGDHNFIQECTRVATLFWIALYLADPVRKRIIAPFSVLLQQTLERSGLQSLWYPNSELLLWIVTTGAFMAKNGDDYDWFATVAAKVATYLELKEEADVKRVLQTFFYVDDIQHRVLAKLVGDFDRYLRLCSTQVRYYDLNTWSEGCSLEPVRHST